MKVEILFPEVCNLYGDLQNVYYLRRCCPELEIVETDLHSKPRFLTEDVALVYMGSTTEQGLALAADALRPYTAEMAAKLDAGQLMLLTGNAPDVFSDAMDSDSADTIKGLGILPGRVKYTMMKRHNSFYLGTFEGMDIVGFKSLFGFHCDAPESGGWFDTVCASGCCGRWVRPRTRWPLRMPPSPATKSGWRSSGRAAGAGSIRDKTQKRQKTARGIAAGGQLVKKVRTDFF